MKLNTRLQLRYDLLSAWESSTLALLAGEVAIAKDGNNLIIKVGEDGVKTWGQLPVANVTPTELAALAERVATLETDLNTATTGLKARVTAAEEAIADIQELLGEGEGSVSDQIADAVAAEATLREAADNAINAKIGAATDEATAETVYGAIAAEAARADAEEKRIVGLVEAEATTARAAEGANAQAIADETTRATEAEEALAGRVKAIEDDYLVEADIANFETKENVKKVADDLADYQTANDAAVALKADQTDLDSTDAALAALKARVEAFLDNTGAATEAIDTLQELINYIETHDDVEMASLIADIQALENKTLLGTDAEGNEYATVKAYVEAAVQAETDRATGAENALDERLDAVEAKFEGENSVDSKIAAALASAQKYTNDEITELVNEGAVKANTDAIAAINNADTGILAQAKTYADGLNTAMDTRVGALETTVGKAAEGENAATGLVKAVADNTAAIAAINNGTTGILAQAKAYTDELANGAVKNNTDAIAAINSTTDGILVKAKAYTDQEVGKLAATVATTEKLGLVKASDTVAVAADGAMSVAKVSTDVLVQGTQEVILHGGNATGYGA